MKEQIQAADHTAQALATATSIAVIVSQAVQRTVAEPITDQTVFIAAGVGGFVGAIVAYVSSYNDKRERVATALASLSMGMFIGPVTGLGFLAYLKIPYDYGFFIIAGTAFIWGIFGWPFYKFVRAMFVVGAGDGGGLPNFIATVMKLFLNPSRFKDKDSK